MTKFELIKRLEAMVAFQSVCLAQGNWEAFDRTENEVKKLELEIMQEEKQLA